MKNNSEYIQESIIRDMSEGVMSIDLNGIINYVNPAAASILGFETEQMLGKRFARLFFGSEENDKFNQTVLDAVYESAVSHKNIVPYFTGIETKHLSVMTSYLKNGDEKIGVVAVISDISELFELRDALKAMEKINALNKQLSLRNQLLNETFGRFLSDDIVKQLLETPDGLALGGKKRSLTIMMSDLRGFTAMSERMEANALLTMLNYYLGKMTEIIQRYGGTIIEFIGDGIMAIFGAPSYYDDHAEKAVAAAIEMEATMAEINVWNKERGYPSLEMGIGINTGEVIVGNIGSEKRTKYGVVGNHVNLCGRIESYTVGGQVLISPKTREMINTELEIVHEQEIFPKGVAEPIIISCVSGMGAPYNVYIKNTEDTLAPVVSPIEAEFMFIVDKHCGEERYKCLITALSEKSAAIKTECDLKASDNLLIDAGMELYCKAIRQDNDNWIVRFTSVPAGFDKWVHNACGGE